MCFFYAFVKEYRLTRGYYFDKIIMRFRFRTDQREVRCKSVATTITVTVGILTANVHGTRSLLGKRKSAPSDRFLIPFKKRSFLADRNYILYPKARIEDFFIMTKEDCILCLQKVYAEKGEYPKKSDFSLEEVAVIKGYFGPWPHALEEAGIIPSKKEERLKKSKEKHIKAKINRRNAKIKKSEVQL